MSTTPTLSEFLLQTDTQIRIFDLGRRVGKLSLTNFQQFERGEVPYPYPYEQTAWIGLLFWNKKDPTQHNIWFLRMPLDEIGCIQLSARDDFMHMLLSRFSEQMNNPEKTQDLKHVLKDNPYVFKPTDDKLAVFHSKSLLILKQAPTKYYTDAINYLKSDQLEQWEDLGVQGISDVATRQDEKTVNQYLNKTLPNLPDTVFNAFAQALENEIIDIQLANIIIARISTSDDENVIASGIRALANCKSSMIKKEGILAALNQTKPNQPMILVAISAKAWEVLEDSDLLNMFIEKLAANDSDAELFNSLMVDLMFMPGMRDRILTEFRNPNRSDVVSNAVGSFFQSMTAN